MSVSTLRKNVSFIYQKRISEHVAHGAHECHGGHSGRHENPCHTNALKTFVRNFMSAFCLRVSLSVVLRLLHLLRTNPKGALSLVELVGEQNLVVRVEAVRLGLFAGLFTGGFNILHCWLRRVLGKTEWDQGVATAIAGGIAGLSVLTQTTENRRTLGMYMFVRLLQCFYNEGKRRQYFKPILHGDSWMFIIGSAQIMYAYVMRPETLPPSYHKFIVRSGPIHMNVLNAVRDNCRGRPMDLVAVNEYLSKYGKEMKDALPPIIGCDVLHPSTFLCSTNFLRVFFQTWKRIFPLYASITFVPIFVLQLFKFLRNPLGIGFKGLLSAGRSASFLSLFCAGYQAVICMQRNVVEEDSRLIYWFAGLMSSFSIFVERPSRRSELALYCLPRAADSLFLTVVDKQWIPSLPYGEVLLFCAATSGLMYFYHNHPHRTTSPLLVHIFNFLFEKKKVHPDDHLHEGTHAHGIHDLVPPSPAGGGGVVVDLASPTVVSVNKKQHFNTEHEHEHGNGNGNGYGHNNYYRGK